MDDRVKNIERLMNLEGELPLRDQICHEPKIPSEAVESPVRAASATRAGILGKAHKCVCGQREEDYGSPEDNFVVISNLWSCYLTAIFGDKLEISPCDVANMMILLKVARNAGGSKLDNWIDIAGYAACGGEIEFG